MNDDVISLKCVSVDEDGKYIYEDVTNNHGWKILHFSPIQMKFTMGCQNNWKIMLCHCALKHNKLVHQLSS